MALSAYKSNMYIHLDMKNSDTQTANICTHTHTHTHTLTHTKHLRAGGLKKKVFEKRIVFREDLKELTEDA